jgi:hypothetical protein
MEEKADCNTGNQNPLLHIAPQKEITLKHKNMEPSKFLINMFDIDDVVDNPFFALVAKRGSGKSWIIKDLVFNLWDKKKIENCIVFAPADKMANFYESFIPKENVFYELDVEKIREILNTQIEKNNQQIQSTCIILDDCLSSNRNWEKNPVLYDLLINTKRYHITLILSMQFPLGINQELRCFIDYVLLGADDLIGNQKRLYDYYAGIFPNFNGFKQTFEQTTQNFDFMCLSLINTGINQNFEDKVKWFKSKEIQNENKIGSIYFNDDVNNDYKKVIEQPIELNIDDFVKSKKKINKKLDLKLGSKNSEIESETSSIPKTNTNTKSDSETGSETDSDSESEIKSLGGAVFDYGGLCQLVKDKTFKILSPILESNNKIVETNNKILDTLHLLLSKKL